MPLKLSRVDVRALAEEAVWMIGSLAGHSTIEVRIGRDPVMARSDPASAGNLPGNAVKFSAKGGHIAVEAHGGRIELESEVGRGTRFWFDLPVSGPPWT